MVSLARPSALQTQQHSVDSVGNIGGMTRVLAPVDIKELAATNGFKESEDMPVARPIDELRPGDDHF
jgi:hypothetical protein